MSGKDLYQIYGSVTDFKNFQGNPMPEWEALPDKIKLAWEAVADAKPSGVEIDLDERQMALIRHALMYDAQFQFAGAPGHNQFILIAKLAKALGIS
jgi:hypothetical protein